MGLWSAARRRGNDRRVEEDRGRRPRRGGGKNPRALARRTPGPRRTVPGQRPPWPRWDTPPAAASAGAGERGRHLGPSVVALRWREGTGDPSLRRENAPGARAANLLLRQVRPGRERDPAGWIALRDRRAPGSAPGPPLRPAGIGRASCRERV